MKYLNICKILTRNSSSFVLSSFQGALNLPPLFPYPRVIPKDQDDIACQMVGPIVKFFEETNNALKNDELENVEPCSLQGLKEMGMFGLNIPEEYGGIGLINSQCAKILEIMGSYDLAVSIMVASHQSIGLKGIMLYGTNEQKEKYLPDLATGKILASYCLTESTSGSDAQSIQSRAVKSSDGTHYILNGSKIWITNAGLSDVFTVFAKTSIVDDKGSTKDEITAFIVDKTCGGISNGSPEKKMGLNCSNTAALFFENCIIPAENVLGGEGNGFKVAMNILNNGRFGIGAILSGTMRSCIEKAVNHSNERIQFGNKISKYGSIQEKLAKMAVKQYVTESMVFAIAASMDNGNENVQSEAAICKVYASEAAWFCCDEAIQIMGGMGYMRECGLEKHLRDLRAFRIFEGCNEVMRLFLVNQGMKYQMKNLSTTTFGSIAVEYLKIKTGFVKHIYSKKLKKDVHPILHDSISKLVDCIILFGSEVQSLLFLHNKNILNQQFELKRMSDCIIEIYAMGVVLSRASMALNNDEPSKDYQANLAKLACSLGSETIYETIYVMKEYGIKDYKDMKLISKELCKFGGVIQPHPVGF